MEYLGYQSRREAVLNICEMLGIEDFEDIIIKEIKNVSQDVDMGRKIDNLNIMVSNQCRMLLKQNFKNNIEWVTDSYKMLNRASEDEDIEVIEQIGYDASRRANE